MHFNLMFNYLKQIKYEKSLNSEYILYSIIGVNLYTFVVTLGPPPPMLSSAPAMVLSAPAIIEGCQKPEYLWNGLDQCAGLIIQSSP